MATQNGPRVAALVGPYLSGKTTLLEALLFASGTTNRRGTIKEGNTVGDHSPEARARADVDGDQRRRRQVPRRSLDHSSIAPARSSWPARRSARCSPPMSRWWCASRGRQGADAVAAASNSSTTTTFRTWCSSTRWTPPRRGSARCWRRCRRSRRAPWCCARCRLPAPEGAIDGYVDLVSERAYKYKPGQASDLVKLPDGVLPTTSRRAAAGLVEKLADFDDKLLEQLLEDVQPSKEEIYRHLTQDLRRDLIVPVFLGAARARITACGGLWKALRHETPGAAETAARARRQAGRRHGRAGDQDLSRAAYRQTLAGARLERPDRATA